MGSLLARLFACFSFLSLFKSHPLKRYRDRLVGSEGVINLDPALLPTPKNGRRLIFIGDVHGCLEELKHLLKKCAFDPRRDHIIFVGDLVAKGPFSLETLTYVDDLRPAASCVRGNHDDKLMQWNTYLSDKSKAKRERRHQAGVADDNEDLSEERLPDGLSRRDEHRFLAKNLDTDQVDFLESLPYIIKIAVPEGPTYLVVHAGVLPDRKLASQKCWDVTNVRNVVHKKRAIDHREDGKGWFKVWEQAQEKLPERERKVVIYGHDAGRDLNLRRYSKGLDSRCVRGGKLTALCVSGAGEQYIHVKAIRKYD